jgi:FMN phosphatase YigB (HAD superfamily)
MVHKTILLDFDGVVFKNHHLHTVVGRKCEQFVNRYVRVKDQKTLKLVNKSLYETTGHTLLGLQKLGYDICFEEFNDFVYKGIDYTSVKARVSEEQETELSYVKKIKSYCDQNPNTDVRIFSNAPDIWCNTISEELLSFTLPTTYDQTKNILKPDAESYIAIEAQLPSQKYVFVDDKLCNLLNVPKNGKWTSVWMNADESLRVKDDLLFVRSLDELFSLDVV